MSRTERLTLSVVPVLFIIEVGVLAYKGALPPPWFVLFVGLAAYRGARAVSYNTIGLPLRELFGITAEPDSSGAGDSTVIKEDVHGVRWVLAELILCPVCSGQWVAMACLALYGLHPVLGSVFTYALAGGGIAELFHWWSENQEWAGRHQREQAGTQWLDKNERVELPQPVPFATPLPEPYITPNGDELYTVEDLEFYLDLLKQKIEQEKDKHPVR